MQTLFGNNYYGEDHEKPQFEDFEGDFIYLFIFGKMFDAKNLNF